jgi:putative methionine-R-sulfoxide reductase with GAF domain
VEADGAAVSGQALWSTLAPRTAFRPRVLSSAIQRLRARLVGTAPSLQAARGSYCLRDVENLGRDQQVERFLAGTAEHGSRILGVDDCVVYLRRERHLVQVATANGPPATPLVLEVGEGIVGAAAAQLATLLVKDTQGDPRYVTDGYPGRSELCVPIVRGGDVVGAIDTESCRANAYAHHHVALIESLALLVANAPVDFERASARVGRRA